MPDGDESSETVGGGRAGDVALLFGATRVLGTGRDGRGPVGGAIEGRDGRGSVVAMAAGPRVFVFTGARWARMTQACSVQRAACSRVGGAASGQVGLIRFVAFMSCPCARATA